jgi:Leucine-rich repeat (LRR) protein
MSPGGAQGGRELGGLTDVTSELGKLVNLRVLRLLKNTRLCHLPDAIRCLQKLEVLHIDECPLQDLPPGFGTLSNLLTLRLIFVPQVESLQTSR